jgi:hypothetical protein
VLLLRGQRALQVRTRLRAKHLRPLGQREETGRLGSNQRSLLPWVLRTVICQRAHAYSGVRSRSLLGHVEDTLLENEARQSVNLGVGELRPGSLAWARDRVTGTNGLAPAIQPQTFDVRLREDVGRRRESRHGSRRDGLNQT